MKTLGDVIRPSGVHHSSYTVARGKLDLAVSFFIEQHWLFEAAMTVVADWGTAIFFRPPNDHSFVQLTDARDTPYDFSCTDDSHLAISVQHVSAHEAAKAMLDWAFDTGVGLGARIEAANKDGSKWFVYLPSVFRFAIEVIQVKDFRYL